MRAAAAVSGSQIRGSSLWIPVASAKAGVHFGRNSGAAALVERAPVAHIKPVDAAWFGLLFPRLLVERRTCTPHIS